jgi:hypothetical protein
MNYLYFFYKFFFIGFHAFAVCIDGRNLVFVFQDFMPKLIDFGLISKQDIGEMSTQKKQITMRRQCDNPYFTLRGASSSFYSFHRFLLIHCYSLSFD